MSGSRPNIFEGVTDYFTELTRMRNIGIHGAQEAERTHASAWVPVTDIFARGDDLVIRVELAGVDPADVALSYSRGALTISGARGKRPADVEFLVHERFYGEFRRLITLPEETRGEQVSSVLDRGLLEITVAGALNSKKPAAERIEVVDRAQGPSAPTVWSEQ